MDQVTLGATVHQGIFIAIEGSDGSGKGTQFKLLVERLRAEGYDVATYDFPQYEKETSYFVREYLNGNYGTAEELGPYTPSLFYALDRFSVAQSIKDDLAAGKVVLSNRFAGSNMAHQGTKFSSKEERQAFFEWLDQLEFGMLQTPRPDKNIVLLVPAATAQKLVDQKEKRSYTDKKRDIHEADLGHLERAVEVYQQLCETFPENFTAIDCTKNDELLSIPAINNLVWERISPLLSNLTDHKPLATQSNSPASGTEIKNSYYTPNTLSKNEAQHYNAHIDVIMQNHAELTKKLSDYVYTQKQKPNDTSKADWNNQLERLIKETSNLLLPIAAIPNIKLGARTSDNSDIHALVAENSLLPMHGDDRSTVELIAFSPRNELDIVPQLLYTYSSLSFRQLQNTIDAWSYKKKEQALQTCLHSLLREGDEVTTALESFKYSFDVICSYAEYELLKQSGLATAIQRQNLTPHFGFSTPDLVSEAGCEDLFEETFMKSMELYQSLATVGHETEAQYTTLYGHKLRCELTMNLPQVRKLEEISQENPGLNLLTKQINTKIGEAHPIINTDH